MSRHILIVPRPPPPIPPPLEARARRDRRSIVVTWRTAFAARRCLYFVFAGPTRRVRTNVSAVDGVRGRGRTRFRLRLRSMDGRPLRWVEVRAIGFDGGPDPKRVLIPVR